MRTTGTSAVFCTKTSDFSKYMVRPHRQGRIEPVRTRREESIFRNFVRTSFTYVYKQTYVYNPIPYNYTATCTQ